MRSAHRLALGLVCVSFASGVAPAEAASCGGWFQPACPKARLTIQPINAPVKAKPAEIVAVAPSLAPSQPAAPLIVPSRSGVGIISDNSAGLSGAIAVSRDNSGFRAR